MIPIAKQSWRRPARGGLARVGAAALAAMLAAAAAASTTLAAEGKKVEHIPASRFTYIHRLPLMDPEGRPVQPDDEIIMPFSYRTTCNKCHEYEVVSRGWHFNATDPKVAPGRPGQPWFWVDRLTGTQLPLSYRDWPNTWRPADAGLTPWNFIQIFGRHMPGGGPGELTDIDDPGARWLVSGKLGINCQTCHSGEAGYDHIEWFLQIAAQNFMWAGAGATELASITGAARGMPPSYDPVMGPEDDKTAKTAPTVHYDKSRFDAKGAVFFDIPGRPPDTRCYFCHNAVTVGPGTEEVWRTDEDIHMAAGMTCTDCHRHGLDHRVGRNYEDEHAEDPSLRTLTCRGCHLGDESDALGPGTMGGRLGAPVPNHVGLPTIHLEKLACTTCHSGPYPQEQARHIQTSMAHALEYQGSFRGPQALPYIVGPVFARRPYDHDRIGPEYMAWPAFWGRLDADKVTPLSPEVVKQVAKDAFEQDLDEAAQAAAPAEETKPAEAAKPAAPAEPAEGEKAPDAEKSEKPAEAPAAAEDAAAKAETPAEPQNLAAGPVKRDAPGPRDLTPARVLAVLAALKAQEGAKGEPVYVSGGHLYRAGPDGKLVSSEHAAAKPVAWPIAHNVRGAGRSLGTGGCTDCHGFGAPVAFGQVAVMTPAFLEPTRAMAMYEFQGRDKLSLQAWAMSYLFRPMFKVVGFATAGIIGAVCLLYVFLGLAALLRWARATAPQGPSRVG